MTEKTFAIVQLREHIERTEVELAVEFLAVDNVEAVARSSVHVADFEVEPLVVVVGVHVWVEYQVVLKLSYLK